MRDSYFKGGFCWGKNKILNAAEGQLRGAASSAALVLRMDHRSTWWKDREENTSILSTCIRLVWHLTEPGPQEVTWNIMEKGYKVKTYNIIFKSCYVIVFNCLEYKNSPATTAEIWNTLSKLVGTNFTWNRSNTKQSLYVLVTISAVFKWIKGPSLSGCNTIRCSRILHKVWQSYK